MTQVEAVDAAAANVARAYALLGYVAVTSRTKGSDVRVIAPQMGAPQIAAHMHRIADVIFDGPCQITQGEQDGNC